MITIPILANFLSINSNDIQEFESITTETRNAITIKLFFGK